MKLLPQPGSTSVNRRTVQPNTGSTNVPPTPGNPAPPGMKSPGGAYANVPLVGGGCESESVNPQSGTAIVASIAASSSPRASAQASSPAGPSAGASGSEPALGPHPSTTGIASAAVTTLPTPGHRMMFR